MANDYQVTVIGAGPGGYVCAIRLAQKGIDTAIVEEKYWGGTCLNVGCIPSKVLLDDSELYAELEDLDEHGIEIDGYDFDLGKLNERKDGIVNKLTGGVKLLLEQNGADLYEGSASFVDQNTVEVDTGDGTDQITSDEVVIATGSTYRTLPGIEVDGEYIISSDEGIDPDEVPEDLLVIGGGYIGLELGSVFNRLGSEVTVVEYMDEVLPVMDPDIRSEAEKQFTKQGMTIHTSTEVTSAAVAEAQGGSGSVEVEYEAVNDAGESGSGSYDQVLVAVGRKPNTDGLNLDAAGVTTDDQGFIETDEELQTSADNIYALGDVVGGAMLAHKANHEGEQLANKINGEWAHFDFDVPAAVFTHPEIAYVGLTEEEAEEQGYEVKTGKFQFSANGKALALGQPEGFVKVIGDKDTDDLLGVHIIGAHASDLINEATMAMLFHASCEDFQAAVRIHPTLGEVVHEAALGVDNEQIHAVNR